MGQVVPKLCPFLASAFVMYSLICIASDLTIIMTEWWPYLVLLSSSLAFRKSDFTDWDCRRVNSKLVLWNTLREVAVAEADAAESSLFTVPNLVSTVSDFETSPEVFEALFAECPLGTIFLLEIALGSCVLSHGQYTFEPCEATGDLLMEFMFRRNVSMAMILTATWPIKQALDMPFLYEFGADTASNWHIVQNSPVYICDRQVADNGEGKSTDGGFDWPHLQELIWIAVRDEEQVMPKVRNVIFGQEMQAMVTEQLQDPRHFEPDCLSGWIATLLIFAGITWHMESYVYFSYEQVLKRYLATLEFWEFFGSGWLLSTLMGQVCVMHRTINEMDFSGSELLKDPHINSIGSLRLKASPIFSATAAAVLGEGARAYSVNGESRLLTYAVYVWGEAFLKWLPAYIKRFHSLGVYNLMVFGDAATYQVCSAIQRAVCLQLDTKNSLHRYTIPLALMNLGVDAFILDFDIYPFQDPTPVLVSEMESYTVAPEFLIGGSFGDACICNALAFYRSSPSLRDFIRGLLDWLYEHPFPHAVSQRALSAFLGEAPMQKKQSTSPVIVKAERLAPWLPDRASPGIAWAVLDPGVQFSSSANLETSGWAGDAEGQQEQLTRLSRILERQKTGPQQGQRKSLVDTKAIGRPEKLGGSLQEASKAWRQWSYRLEMWLASQFPDARKILAWATSQDAEIKVSDLIGTTVTGVTEQVLKDFNRQLEVVLGTLTVDSPGDITMNSSAGSGLDMYRRLHSRLDPTDMVASMRWLTLMSTHPVKEVHELIPAIERWEDMHRRYAERKDCESLKEQQKMAYELTTYDALWREMVAYAENRRAFSENSGAVPMELDAVKGKSKGKGKDKGGAAKKETRTCHVCQKAYEEEAPANDEEQPEAEIRIFLSLTDAWIPRSHFGFRCWCSHGQKRPVAHLENVPEQKRFRVDALDLYLSGDLSGKRAERLFRHAELAGTAHISDVGKPEGSKNSHRDLLRKALQNSLWPKTYETEVRGWNPKSGTVEPMMLAYYLPHEMMHAMLLVNGAEDMLALQEQTLASTLDLREHLREFCNQFRLSDVLALGLWLDGALGESLDGVEQPTCDLVDGLLEETLAETLCNDLTGKELPAEGVKAARAEELSVIRQMGGWEVIPHPAGEKVIGTRWVDMNKGDSARLKLRSRLVAQELKRQRGPTQPEDQSTWSDFFAAMPPLSSLRALLALATTKQVPNDRGKLTPVGSGGEVCLMFLDVKKAQFWSPARRRRLLLELPPEAGEGKDKVGLLKRSLYGTRDAPSNWEKAIKDALEKLGFKLGRSNPRLYFHLERGGKLRAA
eukprot:s2346_g5.t2